MHDETKDIEVRTASEILFWGRIAPIKTKRGSNFLGENIKIDKHSNYQGIATFDEGKASMKGLMKS